MSISKSAACLLGVLLAAPAYGAAAFFWRAEGTTLSATDDLSPDTSATSNGGVSISTTAVKVGTNGILTTDQQDYYIFTSTGICDVAAGTLAGWVQFKTAVPNGPDVIIKCVDSATSSVASLSIGASQEPRMQLSSSGGTVTNLSTAACNFVIDVWYFVVGSWHIANDDRAIACYDSSGALIDSNSDLATDLAASAPGAFDATRVGSPSSNTSVMWVDNIFAATTYAEPFENFHSITSFVPVYTAGPTNGTFTNTTLPFTYTPNQKGTTYAAACTNGQTVTSFANLKAGTCSGGAAVGTGTDASTGGVDDTVTITGLVASTTYDVYIGHESSIGGQSTVSSLPDRTTTGLSINFSVGPSETPATNGFTIAGTITCTGTCTVEAVACSPGDAVPSNTELEAGQCGGGNAALMNAQENWTTGVGNDFLLTSANKPVRFDVYVAGTDGTTDTAVIALTDQDRSPDGGQAIIATTSISATSICDLDSYFTPDVATGDVLEYTNTTTPGGYAVSFGAACDFTVAAGGDTSQQRFTASYQDVSSATDGLLTAPTTGNFTTDDTIYLNNSAPVCSPESTDEIVLLVEDVAMGARDLTAVCTDDIDLDTLTFTVSAGTIPNGTSLSGAGAWTGTPDTENEAGAALTKQACDPAGDCDSYNSTAYVVNTWTVPNLVTNTTAEAINEILAAAPWRVDDVGLSVTSFDCSLSPASTIISQNPAASAQAAPSASISVVVARGCGAGRGPKIKLGLGL